MEVEKNNQSYLHRIQNTRRKIVIPARSRGFVPSLLDA